MENSVVALYAADAGIETALESAFHDIVGVDSHYPAGGGVFSLDNGAEWEVEVVCCDEGVGDCVWNLAGGNPCPFGGSGSDAACGGDYYCFKSRGYYKEAQRAIQVDL